MGEYSKRALDECLTVDVVKAAEMAEKDVCWCCGDTLYMVDSKMIRAKKAECPWVMKIVCCGCRGHVLLFPNEIKEVEGEFWTLRPLVARPGL